MYVRTTGGFISLLFDDDGLFFFMITQVADALDLLPELVRSDSSFDIVLLDVYTSAGSQSLSLSLSLSLSMSLLIVGVDR
jgi:hypothetical protein